MKINIKLEELALEHLKMRAELKTLREILFDPLERKGGEAYLLTMKRFDLIYSENLKQILLDCDWDLEDLLNQS